MTLSPINFKKRITNRLNRNRSLEISDFKPETHEEYRIWEIAKVIGERDVRFLLSIEGRYGYQVIADAWEEMRETMSKGRKIQSYPRFLNYLIQKQIKGKKPP